MRLLHQWWSILVAAVLSGWIGGTAVAAAGAQFLPVLSVREGPLKSIMIPRVDGYIAYLTLLNTRDGGINGVPLVWEECETVYDMTRTVACYERLKTQGPTGAAAVHPLSTPRTHLLLERATQDQIPLLTAGYGRPDTADGRVFPYVFPAPATWWSQNTAKIRFIGQRVGGMAQLKGRIIVHLYSDTDYGRDTLPLLDLQAARYGFAVQHLAIPLPGRAQHATWQQVKAAQPDWIILRTFGVMTPTALQEAARVGFPRDKIVGQSYACAEQDTVPAGEAAIGYICASVLGTGRHFPLIHAVLEYVYARGQGPGPRSDVGTVYWLRGLLEGVLTTEGIRRAMRQFGHRPLTGAEVQWGLDHLTLTAADIKAMGAEGLLSPLTLSCRDHEGGGGVRFQQWDGTQWHAITDWMAPDHALVWPLVEASAATYAQAKGITPRACP